MPKPVGASSSTGAVRRPGRGGQIRACTASWPGRRVANGGWKRRARRRSWARQAKIEKVRDRLQPGPPQQRVGGGERDRLHEAAPDLDEHEFGREPGEGGGKHRGVSRQLDEIGRIVGAQHGVVLRQRPHHGLDLAQGHRVAGPRESAGRSGPRDRSSSRAGPRSPPRRPRTPPPAPEPPPVPAGGHATGCPAAPARCRRRLRRIHAGRSRNPTARPLPAAPTVCRGRIPSRFRPGSRSPGANIPPVFPAAARPPRPRRPAGGREAD